MDIIGPMPLNPESIHWIENSLGKGVKVHNAAPLPGAYSSAVYLIEITTPQGMNRFVLKQIRDTDWILKEKDILIHEVEAMQLASQGGVLLPDVLALDASGEICGFPSLLMSLIDGEPVIKPVILDDWLSQIAAAMVSVHQISGDSLMWDYYPYINTENIQAPDWTTEHKLWQMAVQLIKSPWPAYTPRLIHRDFHPINILWRAGELTGIVDWANACLGPPGIDLGHCRINLALSHGPEVAQKFLEIYQEQDKAFPYDPYWDLISLFDFLDGQPPRMYPPWERFGLKRLSAGVMRQGLEEYLTMILAHF